MQQLGEEERDTPALVVSSDISYRDMAEMTGTSERNVKVRVHRAKVKLRKSPAQENSRRWLISGMVRNFRSLVGRSPERARQYQISCKAQALLPLIQPSAVPSAVVLIIP